MGKFQLQSQPREAGQEPWWVLELLGPILAVEVKLLPAEVAERQAEALAVPQRLELVVAMIDTGASITVVDEDIRAALIPTIYGTTKPKGIRDTEAQERPRFALRFSFPNTRGFRRNGESRV